MFPKGLIVSSQALEGNPLRNSEYLAVMAEAAVVGGAKAIRANGVDDIKEMRKRIDVPIIGIDKKKDSSGLYTLEEAQPAKVRDSMTSTSARAVTRRKRFFM